MRSLLFGVAFFLISLSRWTMGAPPEGFVESTFVQDENLTSATGLGWAPDNSSRLFVIRKNGSVRVVQDGVLLPTPFVTISPVFTESECGLIGFCFDPDFLVNRYIYFFVTVSEDEQQIIRFTDTAGVGRDRTVIVGGLPTIGRNHDGGAVEIGPDGHLYWAIGDLGNSTGVDGNLTSLASKVGRANRFTGAPVADNPFADRAGPNDDYIWARGFRNPFTLTFHPRTGALWLNVVGTNQEQVFIVPRGGHGGWDDFENNQPEGFLTPVIAYRTNGSDVSALTAGGAVRSGGIATFTTVSSNTFRVGGKVTLAGVADGSFNGVVFVRERLSATQFTAEQTGSNAVSGGGTASSGMFGGSITGGHFYESTLFAPEYRGDFFFGDFNSGSIMRARLNSSSAVQRVNTFVTGNNQQVDIVTGPDGALYYAGVFSGSVKRLAPAAQQQGLIVQPTAVRVQEGGRSLVSVRLGAPPSTDVVVNIERQGGSPESLASPGAALVFTPSNWNGSQAVEIRSAGDQNEVNDTAVFEISSPGFASIQVLAKEIDGVAAAQPKTDLLYLTGTPVPGELEGVTFARFSRPSIDAEGVGFAGKISAGGTGQKVVFSGSANRIVAREGQSAPGTSELFSDFGDPVFASGQHAFIGTITPGDGASAASETGVWFGTGVSDLQLLAREGMEAPGAGGATFRSFISLALPGSGGPILVARLKAGTGSGGAIVSKADDLGIWRGLPGDLRLVIREGGSLPGDSRKIVSFKSLGYVQGSPDQRRSFRDDGGLLVTAALDDGTDVLLEARGDGSTVVIRAASDTVLAAPAGATLRKISLAATNATAEGAFQGKLERSENVSSANDAAVLLTGNGQAPIALAREGDRAPTTGGATFADFGTPGFTGAATLVQAMLKGGTGNPIVRGANDSGLWLLQRDSQTLLARKGSPAPSTGGKFKEFRAFAAAPDDMASRAIAFTALTNGGGGGALALALFARDRDGTLHRLAKAGDVITLPGDTTTRIAALRALETDVQTAGQGRSVGAEGQIVYRVLLRRGGEAIYRVQMP